MGVYEGYCGGDFIIAQQIQKVGMAERKQSQPKHPASQPQHKKTPTAGSIKNEVERNFEMRLVNPENTEMDRQGTLKKLIDMNEKYLNDKVKVSDVPRPSKYSHKMPSRTGSSEYHRKYGSASRAMNVEDSTPKQDKSGSLLKLPNQLIVAYESTYHMDYALKKQQQNYGTFKPNKKYEKSQAPNFVETSYHRDYSSTIVPSPTKSAKRMEVRLMGGGKLNADTTYNQNYRVKTEAFESAKPIIHKNNKIFLTLENPVKSMYQQAFLGRKAGPEASCKPIQKYNPQSGKVKYRTEYTGQFVEQEMIRRREFECMSPSQLKDYVMKILDD